ncbi:type II toxin-antitoxin system PemK/MazF family toxin [Clostridium sp. AN503]|uniref:type II toxin-antitoxin system PemK/MazF family toxin n=1 Tax=Clostridium sp. AN503 TaxID=3160598 RepID=UPI003459514B
MKIELVQAQKMLEWLKTKLYLDAVSSNAKARAIKRGQVYRCNFGCGIGSEMQKERPAVIIQNDIGNNRSGNTIVLPITHDTSSLPCVADITPVVDASGNLILDGQANASNIMCVSKARLGDFVCTISSKDMKKIDEAIARTVGLMGYYSDLTKKLADKISYIERIKEERNRAQDELAALKLTLDKPTDSN